MPFITSLTNASLGAAGSGSSSGSSSQPTVKIKDVQLASLWKNASPSSAFGSSDQNSVKIELDLSSYGMVYIEYLVSTSNSVTKQSVWASKGEYTNLAFIEGKSSVYGARRCYVEADGITFEPAYNHSQTKAYTYAIPTAIYGAFRTSTYELASFCRQTVELPVDGWTSTDDAYTQTAEVEGLSDDAIVIVTPAPGSHKAYADASVYASAQSTNAITFTAEEVPSEDLVVSVVWPV